MTPTGSAAIPILTEPVTHRFSAEELYQLLQAGVLQERRVELIEGEIIDMPAQLNFHAASIRLVTEALERRFGADHWVRVQMSLDLTPYSVVDPDVAVILGSARQSGRDNPTSALLVVEVSESTLSYDRHRKASLYARCGIADYWIVNLIDGQLEVYRTPVQDNVQHYGYDYGDRQILGFDDEITPLALPTAKLVVREFFPDAILARQ
jgi:Uma2 family endonuclease